MTHPNDTTVLIPLTQGKWASIDAIDLPLVRPFSWCAVRNRNKWYALTTVSIDGKSTSLYMHRLILNPAPHEHVDHRDGDGLHNTRENLRKATRSQNMANTTVERTNNTTGYKGVYFHAQNGYWIAQIAKKHLGCFATAREAALAYDKAASELYGEFARLNFPGHS